MTMGTPRFADLKGGQDIPSVHVGPWSTSHILRYCAATENWERQHTDYPYATQHDKLPNVMGNGGWRKYLFSRLFREWAGYSGWLWKLQTRYTRIHFPGDRLEIWGRVVEKLEEGGQGLVVLEGGIRNQKGEETSPARAVVALPLEPGGEIKLPFTPPKSEKFDSPFRKPKLAAEPKYLTPEVRAFIGHETEEVESADPVTKSELRRIAQAIPDMDPTFWDEKFAKSSRFGGIVAPSLFPVDGFRQPAHLPDRLSEMLDKDVNFQGGPPWDRRLIVELPLNTTITSNVNGGQEFEILDLARLGETLRAQRKIADIYETESATFGRAVYRIEDVTYKNSEGRVILRGRIALIYR